MSEIISSSRRPYLLRAMHQWVTDNDQTPYIVVDALVPGVEVPMEHVRDNKITLNVSYSAANALELGNEWLMFQARFSGVSQSIAVPIHAVVAIYSKETGEGLIFELEEGLAPPSTDSDEHPSDPTPTKVNQSPGKTPTKKPASGKRSHLRVIK